jgi:hypothetical protein
MFGGRDYQPGAINLIAVPRWLDLAFKSKGVTVEQAIGLDPQLGFTDCRSTQFVAPIVSSQEVDFHNTVTWGLADYLFPEPKQRGNRDELYAKLVRDWHGVPLVKGLKVNLHPIILGSNLIGLYHVEEEPGVTDTDLYGRILRCAHTLAYSKIGVGAFGCDLIKDVLYEISLGQQ